MSRVLNLSLYIFFFFFQAEDGIRDHCVTGVQTCALPISLDSMPAEVERLARVEPVYETLPGWQKSLNHVRRLADLPPPARAYLDRLQDLAHAPIQYVSVGTHRDQIIEVT